MRARLSKAEKTMRACLDGLSTLIQAYLAIAENGLAFKVGAELLDELQQIGFEEAEFKARLLSPVERQERPETIWREVLLLLPQLKSHLAVTSARTEQDIVEFDLELLPSELESLWDNSLISAERLS